MAGRRRLLLVALLTITGLALRLAAAWMPVPLLVIYTLPDDAFIYFVIARHIAAGLGATFDGVAATNGFHPLWALALTPIFGAFPRGDLPVHLALTVSAVCDTAAGVLAGWVVWRAVTPELRSFAATITMALYLFNPRTILESVNGLETGLAVLALAACVLGWQFLRESPTAKRAAVFGGLAGLAVLARSDLGVIVAALWLGLFARSLVDVIGEINAPAGFARSVRQQAADCKSAASKGSATNSLTLSLVANASRLQGVKHSMIAGVAAVVVVAPWFIWSQLRVGTMAQSSGVAIPSLVAYAFQNSNPRQLWDGLLFPVLNLGFRDAIIYPGVGVILLVVSALLLLRDSARNSNSNSNSNFLWLPAVGALLIVIIHTVVRWYPRGWYFVPLAWGVALAAGPLAARGLRTPLGKRVAAGLGIGLGVIVIAQAIKTINEPGLKWQADMVTGAEWLASNTATDEVVGAFNAGIYAYYSERRVINLDGLVDWEAIEARREKRLLDYFVARGGSLLIDHREYIWSSFSPFFGRHDLELVAELPVVDATYGPVVVYRVR